MKVSVRTLSLAISGTGLVLLGILVGLTLYWRQAEDATQQPTDFSAVPARVHFEAPALTLNDLGGVQHSLSDYLGQVVVVNLWATWCPPCKAEMPHLQAYYEKHRAQGFTVIAVEDGDPPAAVQLFVNEYGLTFPVWADPTYQATDHAFKTKNLPTSYVLDRNGVVRLTWVGAINDSNLEMYVTPLIKE